MTIILKRAALASGLFVAVVSPVLANEVSGTVRDVCGAVIPGTSVSIANKSVAPVQAEGRTYYSGSVAAERVLADGMGRYSFTSLAPGQWTITFAISGFQTVQQDIRLPQNRDGVHLNVRLLPDLLLKQELVMPHGDPKIRYRRYSVHGVVRAQSGEPVSAAIVRLQDVGSKKSIGTHPCTTDELGRYAITDWSPVATEWQLSVDADGFRSYTHPTFTLIPDVPRALDLLLEGLKQ
jgi:hypothetical protein